MHLNEIFYKMMFLKLLKPITRYVHPYETMTINKFQRSRLTFDLSANVAHIEVPSIRGVFGKFLAWSFILITDLQTISRLVSF